MPISSDDNELGQQSNRSDGSIGSDATPLVDPILFENPEATFHSSLTEPEPAFSPPLMSPISSIKAAAKTNTPEVDLLENADHDIPLAEYQLRAFARNTVFGALVICIPVSFALIILASSVPPFYLWLWIAIFCIIQAARIIHAARIRMQRPNEIDIQRQTFAAIIFCLLFSAIWASLLWISAVHQSPADGVVVFFLIMAMMIGLSNNYFPIRKAVIPYLIITGVSMALYSVAVGFGIEHFVIIFTLWLVAQTLRHSATFDADVASRKQLISERNKVEIALQENSNSPVWLWSTDEELKLQQLSNGGIEYLESRATNIFGKNFFEVVSGHSALSKTFASTGLKATYLAMQTHRTVENEIIPLIGANGVRWFSIAAEPKKDKSGAFSGYKGLLRDITIAQQRATASIPVDYQTGLKQTSALLPRINENLISAALGRETTAILAVRTTLSSAARKRFGERGRFELMKHTARRLCERFPAEDVTVYDSDTFMVLLYGWGHVDGLHDVANETLAFLRKPTSLRGFRLEREVYLAVSAGPSLNSSPQVLIDNIHRGLDAAEAQNCPVVQTAYNHRLGYTTATTEAAAPNIAPVYSAVLSAVTGNMSHILTEISQNGKIPSVQTRLSKTIFLDFFTEAVLTIAEFDDTRLLFPLSIVESSAPHLARSLLKICRTENIKPHRVIFILDDSDDGPFPAYFEQLTRQLKMAGFLVFSQNANQIEDSIYSDHIDGALLPLAALSPALAYLFPSDRLICVTDRNVSSIIAQIGRGYSHIAGNAMISRMPPSEIIALGHALNRTIIPHASRKISLPKS